jgi:multidrug transporter EmrE-like cation transporter
MSEHVASLLATDRQQFARLPLLETRGTTHWPRLTPRQEVFPALQPDVANSPPWSRASLMIAVAYALSLISLHVTCRHFDLSLAYALGTGSGAAVFVLIGVVEFHEPLSLKRTLWILLVVVGVVALIRFEAPLGSTDLFRLQRFRELPRENRPTRLGATS